jgi:predicted acyl esterase
MTTQGGFRVLDSVEMAMRDGTILRADIWLPGGEGAWPILLQRTAYRKEDAFGTQHISGLEFMAALRRGYAVSCRIRGAAMARMVISSPSSTRPMTVSTPSPGCENSRSAMVK